MSDSNPILDTKLSPLIEGQVPDFIQADYPIYVQFLKSYYKFLESGELKLTLSVDKILRETNTDSYILDETKGEKLVLEEGTGSTGKFVNNEIITGSTSKATATVHVENTSNGRLFISAQQRFVVGETILGGTSGAQGVVVSYRGNPVQNIQQLMEYANPDNTIDEMLENFRKMFMRVIPATLATNVSKRNLIKSIRELYTAKGTSEGHKYFLRLILDDEAIIVYPEKYMLKPSAGKWSIPKIIRTTIPANTSPDDFIGQKITGESSLATALIVAGVTKVETTISFAEYELDPDSIDGTFTIDETVNAIHKTDDHLYTFTIKGVVTEGSISSGGVLHSTGETITSSSSIGNGLATKEVDQITLGSIDDIIIDDVGTNYRVGDSLVFDAGAQSNTDSAAGFVSVIDGVMILEDGDQIVLEDSTSFSFIKQGINLEDASGTLFQEDGTTSTTTLGDKIYHETSLSIYSLDTYGSLTDGIITEDGLSVGSINKIHLSNGGAGYSALPTVTVTTNKGTGTALYASTSNIGKIADIKITNIGFDYTTTPTPILKVHLLVKDVTGTFTKSSNLYFGTGTGTVVAGTVHNWDSTKNILTAIPTVAAPSYMKQEDGTTSTTTFGDDLLLEDGSFIIPEHSFYTGEINHTISQSGSIYATIVKSIVAEGTLTTGTVSTFAGSYPIDKLNTLGEDTVRIQDSYYYQQFSYEVQVGASTAEYMDALKKAVHPSGFLPFGKVSIATQIAAGISILTGKDIPDYTADTETFTPELASTFDIVFDTAFGRRLGTADDGTVIGHNFELDRTDSVGTDAGFNLKQEDGTTGSGLGDYLVYEDQTSSELHIRDGINEDFLTDDSLGIGSGKRDLTLTHEMKIILAKQPTNRSNPNALKILNQTPFINSQGAIGVEGTVGDDILLDGVYTELTAQVYPSPHSVTITQSILSDGDSLVLEDASDQDSNTSPLLSKVGDITFNDIYQYHVIRLESTDDESESIIMEDDFDLLLEDSNQVSDRLPWPDSIWTHSREKEFTFPTTVVLRTLDF